MTKINILALAVPLFIGFILVEYFVSQKRKKKLHQFEESIANLNVGIAERVTDLLTTGAFYLCFPGSITIMPFLIFIPAF